MKRKRSQDTPPGDDDHRWIRLLKLQPGRLHDDVSCKIFKVSLASAPPYAALSYCWGSNVRSKTMRLNGEAFAVTENLWAALRRIRHGKKSRTVWVDALCISQTNDREKSIHVSMMGDIYA